MHIRKRSYEMDMTQGSILPKMLLFAVPLILSSVLQLLFNAADVIVVGQFDGANARGGRARFRVSPPREVPKLRRWGRRPC